MKKEIRLVMESNIKTPAPARIERELKQLKKNLALGFHRGKSLSELKDIISKIHSLEEKLIAFLN
ncbi:hypothetical protein FRZ67_08585 [Panacibacter ginsenosidivorans]|uniref:Uncharacterized protein n=1 Tax=Panacibacter ginsenosidivorans TaxID=1813871 RepID=A0A5B8VAL8_9BACT|nr:hypothetical protein [Panacibacter ginsenosidivorans]QEC67348.1 hypothetical protein FRZ67_08585 [Panacibacter ginsenosidivorans]